MRSSEDRQVGGVTRRLWWLVAAVATTVFAVSLIGVAVERAATPATASGTDYGRAPSFRLVDQNGRPVSSAQFRGKVQVVTFLFPYCTSYCPLLARDMALLQQRIMAGPWRHCVQLVSFNVDPAGAGPSRLRAFISQYGGRPDGSTWEYLTGPPARIRQVVSDGFHVFYNKTSVRAEDAEIAKEKAAGTYTPQPRQPNLLAKQARVNYDIVHNDFVEIVNQRGQIVDFFDDGAQMTTGQLDADITTVLAGRVPAAHPPN